MDGSTLTATVVLSGSVVMSLVVGYRVVRHRAHDAGGVSDWKMRLAARDRGLAEAVDRIIEAEIAVQQALRGTTQGADAETRAKIGDPGVLAMPGPGIASSTPGVRRTRGRSHPHHGGGAGARRILRLLGYRTFEDVAGMSDGDFGHHRGRRWHRRAVVTRGVGAIGGAARERAYRRGRANPSPEVAAAPARLACRPPRLETSSVSLVGRLLVASPVMGDPNFAGSVVLVCAHDDDGAVGLVLDRPTGLPIADHLPGWAASAADPAVVFLGGPVQIEMAVGLGEADAATIGWSPVVGTTGLIDFEDADPSDVGRIRVFAGYAGWAAGQLDDEVASLDWIVVGAHPDDAFAADPSAIRRRALVRKGGLFPAYDHFPDDPRLN